MNIPEKGFYYHYKHDPSGQINNYAYEVVGVGRHTESQEDFFVVYKPLYKSTVYELGKLFHLRPLKMFMEEVTKEGKTLPRFSKITDPEVLTELTRLRDVMYG